MQVLVFVLFFFFSSRRRHTRFDCDWSSDVCSSDLPILQVRLDFFCALAWIRALFLPSSLDKAKTGCYVFIFLCPGFRGPRPGDAGTWLEKCPGAWKNCGAGCPRWQSRTRSEEHTSELQSQSNLVCRLLLEK